ncbi:hypothetical protein Dhaf_0066 [Desulfitobacterium hafniense DCB-2]|uniref:Uncharacterized protein n=1 Tax=Desulfitobacterium hafniense (strain DSM 10664 / DCB-2) TaxID=272564 RepID=B8FY30_DESHD|nr:hypothetical protein Dhaf_0066 [Desulfitobacterium hafniense DCB-2]
METGRFQPAIEQERFGHETRTRVSPKPPRYREILGGAGGPDGAEGLSGSFVRVAYGATGVNQNPGELTFGPE